MQYKLATTSDVIMEDILSALGAGGEGNRTMPLIYSVQVDLTGYFFGDQDRTIIMYTALANMIANCSHTHCISITCCIPPFPDTGRVNRNSYSFKSLLYDSISKGGYTVTPKDYKTLSASLSSSPSNAERLTQATLDISNFLQQLMDVINSSLPNLESLKINLLDSYLPTQQANRIQVDLSQLGHLNNVTFDVMNLSCEDYRNMFLCLEKSQDNEEKAPLYYKCDNATTKSGTPSLSSTTWKFMNDYKRLGSPHTLLITAKLSNVHNFSFWKSASSYKYEGARMNVPLWEEQ